MKNQMHNIHEKMSYKLNKGSLIRSTIQFIQNFVINMTCLILHYCPDLQVYVNTHHQALNRVFSQNVCIIVYYSVHLLVFILLEGAILVQSGAEKLQPCLGASLKKNVLCFVQHSKIHLKMYIKLIEHQDQVLGITTTNLMTNNEIDPKIIALASFW